MPRLIQHIDEIAREQQRDVLFLRFPSYVREPDAAGNQPRDKIMTWLTSNRIRFEPCMGLSNSGVIEGYQGHLYLDVAFDEDDVVYQCVRDYLEDADGNMKIAGVEFMLLPLTVALACEQQEDEYEDEAD